MEPEHTQYVAHKDFHSSWDSLQRVHVPDVLKLFKCII